MLSRMQRLWNIERTLQGTNFSLQSLMLRWPLRPVGCLSNFTRGNGFFILIYPFLQNFLVNLHLAFDLKKIHFYTFVFDGTFCGISLAVCLSICLSWPCKAKPLGARSKNLDHMISMVRGRCLLFFKFRGQRSRSYCHKVGKRCRHEP